MSASVTICTIQRLYSILRGEELDEDADELSGAELAARSAARARATSPTTPPCPIEKFDFIVTDECHRSIYNLWRQVLEYFDAFLIGLTATPAQADHRLLQSEPRHRIQPRARRRRWRQRRLRRLPHQDTQVTEQGGKVEKGFYVDHRSKDTRAAAGNVLDDDLDLHRQGPRPLGRRARSRSAPSCRPSRTRCSPSSSPAARCVPKTLIFAKDDSHAEDIVHICREVFGKGNDFCKKITYQAYSTRAPASRPKSEKLIQEFRTLAARCASPSPWT